MTSIRDTFFNRISELIKNNKNIIIITPDLGAPSLDDFRKDYPDNYISVGIAEQNLISVAAGLQLTGKKVIAYGLNPFPITRAFDQIRTLLAELNIPVTLCALNAGLCSAECGYTHMPIEDMGMMRMLSNIKIINPSDDTIAESIAEDVLETKQARYVRFDKSVNGRIYNKTEIDFQKGFITYGELGGLCIVTFGCYIARTRLLVEDYIKRGDKIALIDLFAIPANKKLLFSILSQCEKVITIEENILSSGIGSYIIEILSDNNNIMPVKRIGICLDKGYYDCFTSREYVRRDQKIDLENITRIIDEELEFISLEKRMM